MMETVVDTHDPLASQTAAERTDAAGSCSVRVSRLGERSVVTRAFATSPVRVLVPSNHGRAAWMFLSSYGGGLVDGDRTSLDALVDHGATAYISTQASTKVYRSPRGTSAILTARVERDALLVLMPDPVVCFTGSRYRQRLICDLAPGGAAVVLDWMTSGRRASGERWCFEEYASWIEVRQGPHVVAYDSVTLRPSEGVLAVRMGRFDVLATAIVVGGPMSDLAAALVARYAEREVASGADLIVAAATLPGGQGCLLRWAGRSVEQVGGVVRDALSFVPTLLGEDPWARKW